MEENIITREKEGMKVKAIKNIEELKNFNKK